MMNDCMNGRQCCVTEEKSACKITALPDDTVTTMAYVPFQLDLSYYCPSEALCKGTLFRDLNKPFKGRCVR